VVNEATRRTAVIIVDRNPRESTEFRMGKADRRRRLVIEAVIRL
jgi:hypothetical protein